jgi:hypothetical protein
MTRRQGPAQKDPRHIASSNAHAEREVRSSRIRRWATGRYAAEASRRGCKEREEMRNSEHDPTRSTSSEAQIPRAPTKSPEGANFAIVPEWPNEGRY